MATIKQQTLDTALARLQAEPLLIEKADDRVRIAHLTPVPREECPRIHVAVRTNRRTAGKDCDSWLMSLSVQLHVRGDRPAVADDLLIAVLARLKPGRNDEIPYPKGVAIDIDEVSFEDEVADKDVSFTEINFRVRYATPSWEL